MKLFCNKLRQIYASRRQDRGFEMGCRWDPQPGSLVTGSTIHRQTNKSENGTKPTNKQTMKRKTAALYIGKRRVFVQRNLSKALCNKVENPVALFSAFTPQMELTGLTRRIKCQ
ncbi:uncharacterized protein LOC108118418 [Drosophila eugracilis]|uniref:uncharacterized protein LOC108118418 n=1 Tax=Drosophila eugracilis TaxID=29029 RepID=UPI001BDB602E|nr:uncharacterized protein LOC108118418 [Drosophila eugracilis]